MLQGLQPTTCLLVIILDTYKTGLSTFDARALRQAGKQLAARGIATHFVIKYIFTKPCEIGQNSTLQEITAS